MQDALRASTPVTETTCEKIYSGRFIFNEGIDDLIHFASGVFWKAAACRWQSNLRPLELGPYQEPLRSFVCGQDAFPENAALWISVWEEDLDDPWMATPHLVYRDKYRSYRFDVLGVAFLLIIGKAIDSDISDYDVVRGQGNPIILSPIARRSSITARWLYGLASNPVGLLATEAYHQERAALRGRSWSEVRRSGQDFPERR
jgi:hypothetical protein